MSELHQLQTNLNKALDAIREELEVHRLPDLSSFSAEPHPLDSPEFICPPRLYEARRLALGKFYSSCATLGQLDSLLQRPYDKVVKQSAAVYDTACLDLIVKAGILDKLANAEDITVGLSVISLESELDIDSKKITPVLRYLSAQGWLRETTEGVFTLTRTSLELREGCNGRKWILTEGKPRIAMALMNQITHPDKDWRYSGQSTRTAFQLAYNTDKTLFEHLKDHPDMLRQWASSVQESHRAHSRGRPGKRRCCIGSNVGSNTDQSYEVNLIRVSSLPNATLIVQELGEVVPLAKRHIQQQLQNNAEVSRINVETHNFFDPQQRVGENHVFVLRHVLHNWPDNLCVQILANLAADASTSSRVIIVDAVIAPCITSTSSSAARQSRATDLDELQDRNEYCPISAPPYIPLNFGTCAIMPLALGVHLMGVLNAYERTASEWSDLVGKAGLRIVAVHPLRGMESVIECQLAEN
ncbi:hypothetical protein CERSUDRAFT_77587 [Gelatoporia subvermispora B]|uniref:O-methyltransferase C-terminal domain-containing protein n=1 Tax=Ceriporiopsis subvermispora (strain B) TaxID=914234 RepID=M2P9Z0_CERS8|nr:hypothetical protein CERSUDRAFT_77587 [Gelatoporia subvermispora B]